jgi:adenosylhomocysteine nucleosidase
MQEFMSDLVVFALEDEAPNLFSEYSNVHCIGVGKVNAAINTMRLCHLYHPNRIINLGTAGGISLTSGVHRINTVWQHDVNLMALGLLPGVHFNDPVSMITIPGIGKTCASGDIFITEPQKIRIECDMVDMEAYSVAKVANRLGIDIEIWKYISDPADIASGSTWKEQVAAGEPFYRTVLKQIEATMIN